MTAIAITAAILAPVAPAVAPDPYSYAMERGCRFEHPSADAYRATTRLLRHERPVGAGTKHRVHKWSVCLATRRKAHAVHVHVRRLWKWRHTYPVVYAIKTNRFPGWVLDYLAALRPCEGGRYGYTADTGNTFYGAYQFTWGTWASVGGSGNPAHAAPAEQDYRAGVLLTTSGSGHWPNCP